MIVDVPTATDFRNHGAKFLNLAWDVMLRHADAMNAFEEIEEIEAEEREAFARSISADVSLAVSLAHTGVDHLLKAGIAEVSPYLLVSSGPRDWPKPGKQGVSFADFHTLESQELVRAYSVVAAQKLPDEFVNQHEKIRQIRNRLIHTVDPRLAPAVKDLILAIFVSTHTLVGPAAWIAMRRVGIDKSPGASLNDLVGTNAVLALELRQVVEWLGAGEVKRYLGIDKKRRFYSCPGCLRDCERDAWEHLDCIAQLASKDSTETILRCVACGVDSTVSREKCRDPDCKGNVLWPEHDDYCLTCRNWY